MTYVITIRLPNSRRPSLARARLQTIMRHIEEGLIERERPGEISGYTLRGNAMLGRQCHTPKKGTPS